PGPDAAPLKSSICPSAPKNSLKVATTEERELRTTPEAFDPAKSLTVKVTEVIRSPTAREASKASLSSGRRQTTLGSLPPHTFPVMVLTPASNAPSPVVERWVPDRSAPSA